jgi:hypothetical protein
MNNEKMKSEMIRKMSIEVASLAETKCIDMTKFEDRKEEEEYPIKPSSHQEAPHGE